MNIKYMFHHFSLQLDFNEVEDTLIIGNFSRLSKEKCIPTILTEGKQ
jgi:hypothetical protein